MYENKQKNQASRRSLITCEAMIVMMEGSMKVDAPHVRQGH